jgi:beta-barrel assembly-enhancing protease
MELTLCEGNLVYAKGSKDYSALPDSTMIRRTLSSVLLLAGITALTGIAHAYDTPLPDIGSSAGTVASPEEQRQYGFYMVHELRNQGLLLDDELLTDYLNTLGYRLVSFSPKADQPFTFFTVRDNEINAFALPGGFVGVNIGLITMTRNEDELAAVLAHEVSHITQNHLVRAVEAEQKMAPLMVLAMIGAIAASAHQNPYSTSNTGEGAIAVAQGLAAQMQINFTRSDETEADRVGIQTLAKAGYDPDAMADAFEDMQRALRPGFDENDVPAMLMDHPVTTERISEARARAAALKKDYKPVVTVGDVKEPGKAGAATSAGDQARPSSTPIPSAALLPGVAPASTPTLMKLVEAPENRLRQRERSEAYFDLMRERVRVLGNDHAAQSIAWYTNNMRNTAGFDTPANRYGLALALTRGGRAKEAIESLQKLADADADNLAYQLALGDAELYAGQRDLALQRYARLEKNRPNNRALALAHAQALLHVPDNTSGHQAQEILRPLLTRDDEDPQIHTVFGRASDMAGDKVRAGESYAVASYLNGRAEDAYNQLKELSKRTDLDYYQRKRIEALIEQMTPIVLELRRRKIKPADQGKMVSEPKSGLSVCFSAACEAPSSSRNNPPLK